ncbi:Leucine-rich repeat - like 10 [Theobroma cacao]|nr:Leucine-rich repeat - like 10 [Theobroma cacao]
MPSEVSSTVPLTSSEKQNQSNEVMALLAFKHSSVEADPNGFQDNWNPASLSPCSWVVVSCSPSGQHLYLRGNSFSGYLFLNKVSYPCIIETLDLSFNNLSEPISKTFFDSCDRLTSLNLSHNLIPGGSFDFGTFLLELDLSSNLISDSSILNSSFLNCQNLRLLNLSYNKLSAELGAFSSCGKLSILDLSNNMLSGDIPTLLVSDLPGSLEFLDISHNNISGNFSALEFKNCAKLSVLNLSNNALYGTGIPHSLTNCRLLEKLDLS